jgi:magnesium transporter
VLENTIDHLSQLISDVIHAENDQQLAEIMANVHEHIVQEQYPLLLEALPVEKRLVVWQSFSDELKQITFVELGEETRRWLLDSISDQEAQALLAELDVEEVIELAEEIPDRFLNYAIKQLDDTQRKQYYQAQQYSTEQIGHWLDFNYVRISEKMKVASAKRLLLKGLEPYTDEFYAVNKAGELVGVLPINTLLTATDDSRMEDLLQREFTKLHAEDDVEDAAETVILSDKMALPVVNDKNQFVGRIHSALAHEIKLEALTEQMNSQAGLSEDEDLFSSVTKSAKNRGIWLGINLATAFLASWFIGLFEATLQQVVALAVLMPVVASMGGIAGSQTLTVIVRGLALGQITDGNRRALLFKELKVGALNGVIWSIVIGGITLVWFNDVNLGIVIALAILLNLLAAALSGVVIPAFLDKLNIDPALSGSVILTTVTDVVGFVVFLGLGSLLLL